MDGMDNVSSIPATFTLVDAKADQGQDYRAFMQQGHCLSLNGIRCSHCEWNALVERRDSVICAINCQTKTGEDVQLLSLLGGILDFGSLKLSFWVFDAKVADTSLLPSILASCFTTKGLRRIVAHSRMNERNRPFYSAFAGYGMEEGEWSLAREDFFNKYLIVDTIQHDAPL